MPLCLNHSQPQKQEEEDEESDIDPQPETSISSSTTQTPSTSLFDQVNSSIASACSSALKGVKQPAVALAVAGLLAGTAAVLGIMVAVSKTGDSSRKGRGGKAAVKDGAASRKNSKGSKKAAAPTAPGENMSPESSVMCRCRCQAMLCLLVDILLGYCKPSTQWGKGSYAATGSCGHWDVTQFVCPLSAYAGLTILK